MLLAQSTAITISSWFQPRFCKTLFPWNKNPVLFRVLFDDLNRERRNYYGQSGDNADEVAFWLTILGAGWFLE